MYSRNFSVLRMQFLSEGAYSSIKELTNGKYYFTPLFVKSSDGKVDAYYDFSSPEQVPKKILDYLAKDIPFVKEKFSKIKSVCKEVNEIVKSNDESKAEFVFENLKKIQPFSTLGKLIGEMSDPSKELFDIFGKFRFDYDGLMYRAEKFLLECAKKKGFSDVDYLTFEEIFKGKQVESLPQRKKGFAFFKGKIILLDDFDKFLNENKIYLEDFESLQIIEKSITRDWPLFIAQMLLEGFTTEFSNQIGFSYSKLLFDFHDNQLDVYRSPKEHMDEMRSFLIKKLKEDSLFLDKCVESLLIKYNSLMENIDFIEKQNLKSLSDTQLFDVLNSFIKIHSEIEPTFVIAFWFPIQMENHPLAKEFEHAINAAKNARKATEKVGPRGDFAAMKLCKEIGKELKLILLFQST